MLRMNEDSNSSLGQRVPAGRYRIIRPLGSGGMAKIYLAQDLRLERLVAVKIIHSHLSEDSEFAARFQREAVLAAKLNHPNLVNVFDQGSDADQPYLVMEYVPGRTLREVLNEFGSLSSRQMLNLMQQILSGLAAAHSAGIVHRDIKPENVLMADDGRVKLGDFGLASSASSRSEFESLLGTAAYVAPELVTTGIADERSDVYSAGILMFELLTGRQPFQGDTSAQVVAQHTRNSVPPPSTLKPDISEALDDLILHATEREPELRPANANVLLSAVVSIKSELPRTSVRVSNQTAVINDNSTQQLGTANQTEIFSDHEELSDESVPSTLDRHQTKHPLIRWIVTSALLVVLGAGAGWWFGAGPGALRAIPNLAGRVAAEAVPGLEQLGFKVQILPENSNDVPAGQVIRTEPASGQLSLPGAEIKVYNSLGPKLMAVPNILGKDVAAATEAVLAAGFSFGGAEAWFNELPVGQVFEYLGSDGTKQAAGSAITVKISLGPLPTVANIPQQTAVDLITSAGLAVNKIETEFSESVAAGNVINMLPLSQPVGAGTKVDLVVSKGSKKVTMPRVVGETIAAAQTLLQSIGLRVVIDTNKLQSQYGIAKVNGVSIAPGTVIDRGTTVTIRSR